MSNIVVCDFVSTFDGQKALFFLTQFLTNTSSKHESLHLKNVIAVVITVTLVIVNIFKVILFPKKTVDFSGKMEGSGR